MSAQSTGGEISRKSRVGNNVKKKQLSTGSNEKTFNKGINRNINGIVLGKSTKQDVINYLKRNKIQYEYDVIAGSPAISYFKNVSFGGITWQFCSYSFLNNIVYEIGYTKAVRTNIPKETIDTEHSFLMRELKRKYRDYSINNENRRGFEVHTIRDENTTITVEIGYENSTYLMSITYRDINLFIDKVNSIHDEL